MDFLLTIGENFIISLNLMLHVFCNLASKRDLM